MIPRFRPNLGWRELLAALTPPRSEDVERFERAFADEMQQRHAVAFPYGRTGLMLLLEALGIRGMEVICPAYTCVVVAHAIVLSGNTPIFVDSDARDFNMDLDKVPAAITERTGALIATSIFGCPVDLDRLDRIRASYPRLIVIQDCAHSFAAEWNGHPVQRAGRAAIFGLNISKIVTSIFGGMVTTDDDQLAHRLRAIRQIRLRPASMGKSIRRLLYLFAVYPSFWPPFYTLVNALERAGCLARFVKYYDESLIDMPLDCMEAMTAVEARVGRVQIGRYREIIRRRRAAATEYDQLLAGRERLALPPAIAGATYSHYTVRSDARDHWLRKGIQRGVQLGSLVEYSVPELRVYRERYSSVECPVAAQLAREAINLPVTGGARGARMVVERLIRT